MDDDEQLKLELELEDGKDNKKLEIINNMEISYNKSEHKPNEKTEEEKNEIYTLYNNDPEALLRKLEEKINKQSSVVEKNQY